VNNDIMVELNIPAEHRYLSMADAWMTAYLERQDDISNRDDFCNEFVLAAHEMVANVMDHAYGGRGGQINLTIDRTKSKAVVLRMVDRGKPFNTQSRSGTTWGPSGECTGARRLEFVSEPEWDQVRGRGLFLASSLLDSVVYCNTGGENLWLLTKLPK
jgi:anti-sigma regulatory factor (Ser/Thr protein kinase)